MKKTDMLESIALDADKIKAVVTAINDIGYGASKEEIDRHNLMLAVLEDEVDIFCRTIKRRDEHD